MTEKEILNADGSRNFQANILLDNLKRLEKENAELKAYKDVNEDFKKAWEKLKAENFELKESLKCFQTPEAIKALTFYKTGEFELQEKKCIELEQENAELKAENERLKEDNGKLFDKAIETRKENVVLQESFVGQRNAYKKLNSQYIENCEYTGKLEQTLQEIKAITELPKPFIDFSEIKTATEVEYDYAAICKELELRLHKVLELITKAESEEE